MLMTTIVLALFVATVATSWFFIIRPIINSDRYNMLRAQGATILEAVRNFRTMAFAKFVGLAHVIIAIYDGILPYTVGVDWTPITSMLPGWAWPIITLGLTLIFAWLRMYSTGAVATPAPLMARART